MNKLIEWKDEYNLGVGGLDHEHIEWVERANRVVGAIEAGSSGSAVNDAFFALIDSTVKHFDLEETHMEQSYYPDLVRHRNLHDRHIRDLLRFWGRCHRGEFGGEEAATFLLDWLLEHILQADADLAPHIQRRDKAT